MSSNVRTVFADLLSRFFWITAFVMMALGQWLPGDWTLLRPLIPVFLGGILFCTALKVPLGDVVTQLHPRNFLALTLLAILKLVVLGGVGWLVAQLIAPEWALGAALVMAMPAGLSSPAMADLYRGHVGFALVFTLITSILAPLSIPLLITILDPGTTIDAQVLLGRAAYILILLAAPMTLAQIVRRLAPQFVQRHYGRWGYGAVLSSCVLIFVSISSNRGAWAHYPAVDLVMPLVVCTVALSVSLVSSIAIARWWRGPEGVAYGFCCLWLNNGLAVAFADRFYHGNAGVILPAILMQPPIVLSVAILGRWWQARQRHLAAQVRLAATAPQ
jgi:bile acid:Na+ symporter, BASS family